MSKRNDKNAKMHNTCGNRAALAAELSSLELMEQGADELGLLSGQVYLKPERVRD